MSVTGHGLDHDVLVIGSGFGGSVTALRLTEKGYRVGVLGAGRRVTDGADELAPCFDQARPMLGVTNYLHLAEQAGAVVHELTTVTDVRPLPHGGYALTTCPTDGLGAWRHGADLDHSRGAASTSSLHVDERTHVERATSLWPHRGEADPRPTPEEPYRRIPPVAPRSPGVPAEEATR